MKIYKQNTKHQVLQYQQTFAFFILVEVDLINTFVKTIVGEVVRVEHLAAGLLTDGLYLTDNCLTLFPRTNPVFYVLLHQKMVVAEVRITSLSYEPCKYYLLHRLLIHTTSINQWLPNSVSLYKTSVIYRAVSVHGPCKSSDLKVFHMNLCGVV